MLTGTPGIGKTFAGVYFAWKFVHEGFNVAYVNNHGTYWTENPMQGFTKYFALATTET